MLELALQKVRFKPGSWIRSDKIVILNVVVNREVFYTCTCDVTVPSISS